MILSHVPSLAAEVPLTWYERAFQDCAALVHPQLTECFVRSANGILRKFARFRVVMRNMKRSRPVTGQEKRKETEKRFTIQIQGFARREQGGVNRQGREDLDPIEEAAGQKTGRGGLQHKEVAKGI